MILKRLNIDPINRNSIFIQCLVICSIHCQGRLPRLILHQDSLRVLNNFMTNNTSNPLSYLKSHVSNCTLIANHLSLLFSPLHQWLEFGFKVLSAVKH